MLLDNEGFDLWANNYDEDVNLSNETNTYPFAGYKDILAAIYTEIMRRTPCRVLDIGIGSGVLATKLYEAGNFITGLDFSEEMLKIARDKMPLARLIKHNFTGGLPAVIAGEKFDYIVLTYAIHHLTFEEQSKFLLSALDYLSEGGCIIVGDIAFENSEMLAKCQEENIDTWDTSEFYLVYSELVKKLGDAQQTNYNQVSHCGGIFRLWI